MHHTLLNNKHDIEAWLQTYYVQNYTINSDMSVDVEGDVDLSEQNLCAIAVQFNHVKGIFNCGRNQITSLLGAPSIVDAGFYCSFNQLTSLKFCPLYLDHTFSCSNNQLRSLEHCPKHIGRNFNCKNNQIKNLEFCPEFVGWSFFCNDNPLLEDVQKIINFEKIKMIRTETLIQLDKERLQHQLLGTPNALPKKTHKI